jgi:uncharacterized protein (DUF58 family)
MITKSYIAKIKANITIHASHRTANLLDGKYKSIFKGRNVDFDDLREYVVGDDIKDIDWKSSARSGNILIKRCSAEKKHNIMLVLDTGKKMLADTRAAQPKAEVAIMSAGIIAYLAHRNGDYVGAIYNREDSFVMHPLKQGLHNLEKILYSYERDIGCPSALSIEHILDYMSNTVKRKMILFVITDLEGMEYAEERTLRKLNRNHDILFVNVSDADMSGNNAYDMDKNFYIPKIILKNNKLDELERQIKAQVYSECLDKFKKHRVSSTSIDTSREIPVKIIDLLERHRYANIR